jgi:hypothetical protein
VSTVAPRVQLKEIGPITRIANVLSVTVHIFSDIHMFSCTTVIFFFLPFDFNHKCDERASCIVYVILAILLSLGKLQKISHLITLTFVFM